MHAHKKMRAIMIVVVFIACNMSNASEKLVDKLAKRISFSKQNNQKIRQEDVSAEKIAPEDLSDYIGKTVLWKKNSTYFHVVELGERVGDTRSYQIYQMSDRDKQTKAGVACPDDQLYRLLEQQ